VIGASPRLQAIAECTETGTAPPRRAKAECTETGVTPHLQETAERIALQAKRLRA
jgi:hypothetical protein